MTTWCDGEGCGVDYTWCDYTWCGVTTRGVTTWYANMVWCGGMWRMWNVVYGVVWCVWGVVWTTRGVTTRGVTTWYANSGMEHSVTTWCGLCGLQGGV